MRFLDLTIKFNEKLIFMKMLIIIGAILCSSLGSQELFSQITSGNYPSPSVGNSTDDKIVRRVDQKPRFNGDYKAFMTDNLNYPSEALEKGVSGVVTVEFTITSQGEVTSIRVLRGLGYGCDEEAIRVVKLTNKMWTPGMVKGEYVNCKLLLPVRFEIRD